MEETKFQQITIKPIHGTDGAPSRYRLSVDGFPPHLWTEPGIYNTPEEVVASSIRRCASSIRPGFWNRSRTTRKSHLA